jgi:hypothetical protein
MYDSSDFMHLILSTGDNGSISEPCHLPMRALVILDMIFAIL